MTQDKLDIRLNGTEALDEIVGAGPFHLEQMDDNHWWMLLQDGAGNAVHVHLKARGRISATFEREHRAAIESKPQGQPVAVLRTALERIERWFGEFPETGRTWDDGTPMSYAACWGSNGERDYMRGIAAEALAASPSPSVEPAGRELREAERALFDAWLVRRRGPQGDEPGYPGPRAMYPDEEACAFDGWLARAILAASTPAVQEQEAGREDALAMELADSVNECGYVVELLKWAHAKLHYRSFDNMDDALQLDRIKLYLEHGVAG